MSTAGLHGWCTVVMPADNNNSATGTFMQTINDYHDIWDADAPLDLNNLQVEAGRTPILHAKWMRHYSSEKQRYKKLDLEYKLLYRQKWEWYLGKLDDTERLALHWDPQPLKILSASVGVYLDADAELQAAVVRRFLVEEILRFLESVITHINKRDYTIKNAIDFMKFSMGV